MILTYIYHSGFMLEGVSVILIFDFWRDADNSIVERTLSTTHKRVYFLASHFHQDHFNPEILNLPVPHGKKEVILSRDIYRRRRAGTEGVTAYLRRGESYRDDLITVHAFGSTDSGVSWAVHVEDKDIFHAGDLNNWHWEEESTPEEIRLLLLKYADPALNNATGNQKTGRRLSGYPERHPQGMYGFRPGNVSRRPTFG